MRVGAAIVTYGDRSHFEGIHASIKTLCKVPQVKKILVIQNGVEYDLQSKIDALVFTKPIELIINRKNSGSAGGFSQALKYLSDDSQIDHVLLLDDDTRLMTEAITNIEKFESKTKTLDKHIWALFREQRYGRKNFEKNWDYNLNYFKNRFVSVSLGQYFCKQRMITPRNLSYLSNLLYAPYAGMLISQEVFDVIGFPDINYYLYQDDIDYSLKLKINGYKIYQIEEAALEDLSPSWSTSTEHSVSSFFNPSINPGRYLYSVRNSVYLSRSNGLITNRFIYTMNRWIYKSVVFFVFMPKNKLGLSRYRQLLKALKDGENGRLGFNKDYLI